MTRRDIDKAINSTVEQKFLEKTFHLGDLTGKKGWDCLNSLAVFYKNIGAEFPMEFTDSKGEKWDNKNYPKRWKKNEVDSRVVLKEFLESLGEPIDFNYRQKGDLLLFEPKGLPLFPAIFLGNGNVMMVFKEGVKILPFKLLKRWVKGCRRLTK